MKECKNELTYRKVNTVPPIGTRVRITVNNKQYTGVVFCTPYDWRPGETHFSIKVPCGAVPVFVVERCVIEIPPQVRGYSAEEKVAVNNFVSALSENIRDLDPQISKLVDEHFRELV